jgi:hypothetical protein
MFKQVDSLNFFFLFFFCLIKKKVKRNCHVGRGVGP